MGILIVILLLSTITYLCFSILRLFYLDTLKTYKLKTLKGLGKHRHYFNSGDPTGDENKKNFTKKFKKALPTLNTQDGQAGDKVKGKPGDLHHPPGKQISYTSPPYTIAPVDGAKGAGYPHVIDMMETGNLNEVSHFPSKDPRMFMGGPGTPSKIPLPVNKQGRPWKWNPNWYKQQVVEEKDAKIFATELKTTKSQIQATASQQFPPTAPVPAIPQSSQQKFPPTVYRKDARFNQSEPAPKPKSDTDDDAARAQQDVPRRPFLLPPSTPYEFVPNRSIVHTAIPKPQKKIPYKQQLMILRGGPRRDSEQIKELKLQKKLKGSSGELSKDK